MILPILTIGLSILACLLLVAATGLDVAARAIPNRVPAALAAVGLSLQIIRGNPLAALGAALAVFVAAAFCWRRGWMGGGDVKLLAAAALLVAPGLVPGLIAAVAFAGGGLALLYLSLGRLLPAPAPARPTRRLARVLRIEQRRIRRRLSLPYAAAIAVGALFTLLTG
ncbi:MAG: prepilin peptidase [Acidisphaera sp.]|nr:prepilin peptidase [Acidisphaera sp.]